MPVCVQPGLIPIQGGGMVEVMMPAPPGPGCGWVVFSSAEASDLQAAANNPFALTTEDGLLVAGAISSLWALAWGIRAIRKALD